MSKPTNVNVAHMTLRDHFAGLAMQAMITNCDEKSVMEAEEWAGHMAYAVADAMLEAREVE